MKSNFLVLVTLLLAFSGCKPDKPLARMYALPEFTLVEQNGREINKTDFQGRVWVANFFFATCPSICKDLNGRMRQLDKEFSGESGFRLASITTDAQNDTPEALKKYAESMGASAQWLFLTGKKADLYKLSIDGFKLALQENIGAGDPIIHSGKMVLVDKAGMIRGYYDGVADLSQGDAGEKHLKEEQKRLVADIHRLLKE